MGGAGYGRGGASEKSLGKAEEPCRERSGGQWFKNFHEGFKYRIEGIGYLSHVSPFLILEASVVLSGLLKREKAVASAPWAEPKGPDAAPGRLAS